jgi:hypothetical protein
MAIGSRRSAAPAAHGASRHRSERRSYRRTEYTRDAAAARSQAECRDAVSTAVSTGSRPLPAPTTASIERTLPPPAGPPTDPWSPVPTAPERPRPRTPDSANAEAACKSRRSRAEPSLPPHRDWQNERAAEARRDRTPGIRPPRNRDRGECRAPLPRHQKVLEWSAPLWLNVRTEIFVPPSDSYSRNSYCRTRRWRPADAPGSASANIGSHPSLRFEPHAPQQCSPAAQAEDQGKGTGIYDERL